MSIEKEEVKSIITDENELGCRSDEIDIRKEGQEMQKIIGELKAVIREKNLKGLAAPCIGHFKRIFVLNFNGDLRSFVNPIISKVNGITLSKETCECIPEKTYLRIRNNDIDITYQTPLGKVETRRFVGLAAMMAQHEIDHLDGLLLSDVGLEIDEEFENASEEERQEVINAYLDCLDLKQKQLEAEIEKDDTLKKTQKAIEFMTDLQQGKIQLADKVTKKKEKTNG